MEQKLKEFSNKEVSIMVRHTLYGEQHIQCVFTPFIKEDKIGFTIKDKNIFMYRNEIINEYYNDNSISIVGTMMAIEIALVK